VVTSRSSAQSTGDPGCLVAGIDLAWGETKADGVCLVSYRRGRARVLGYAYPQGDEALVRTLAAHLPPGVGALLAIDAPIVCPNATGTRPVDRLTHTLFHREHAACHPANLGKSPRPPRVLARLAELGITVGTTPDPARRQAAEVYPHPAMVRLFRLPRIIKYKKGRVAEKRREFARLQGLLRKLLAAQFPWLAPGEETDTLLGRPWSKAVEDQTDALFCALLGLWHLHHRGGRSEVIGDLATGFILLPRRFDP
jgi:predicted RNase H-like nuclease